MKTLLTTNQSKAVHVDHPESRRMSKAIGRYTSHPMELNMNGQDLSDPIDHVRNYNRMSSSSEAYSAKLPI